MLSVWVPSCECCVEGRAECPPAQIRPTEHTGPLLTPSCHCDQEARSINTGYYGWSRRKIKRRGKGHILYITQWLERFTVKVFSCTNTLWRTRESPQMVWIVYKRLGLFNNCVSDHIRNNRYFHHKYVNSYYLTNARKTQNMRQIVTNLKIFFFLPTTKKVVSVVTLAVSVSVSMVNLLDCHWLP